MHTSAKQTTFELLSGRNKSIKRYICLAVRCNSCYADQLNYGDSYSKITWVVWLSSLIAIWLLNFWPTPSLGLFDYRQYMIVLHTYELELSTRNIKLIEMFWRIHNQWDTKFKSHDSSHRKHMHRTCVRFRFNDWVEHSVAITRRSTSLYQKIYCGRSMLIIGRWHIKDVMPYKTVHT